MFEFDNDDEEAMENPESSSMWLWAGLGAAALVGYYLYSRSTSSASTDSVLSEIPITDAPMAPVSAPVAAAVPASAPAATPKPARRTASDDQKILAAAKQIIESTATPGPGGKPKISNVRIVDSWQLVPSAGEYYVIYTSASQARSRRNPGNIVADARNAKKYRLSPSDSAYKVDYQIAYAANPPFTQSVVLAKLGDGRIEKWGIAKEIRPYDFDPSILAQQKAIVGEQLVNDLVAAMKEMMQAEFAVQQPIPANELQARVQRFLTAEERYQRSVSAVRAAGGRT